VGLLVALEGARDWIIPLVAIAVLATSAVLGGIGILPIELSLAVDVVALLVLMLGIALRPLLAGTTPSQARLLGLGVALVWGVLCYAPFHARLFPGTPLVSGAQVTASGTGLPLRIPAAGHGAVDLLLEGKLDPNPTGGVAPPVQFRLALAGGSGTPAAVEGRFDDTLRTQRLGRRGSAVVHQTHTADVRVLANPSGQDITVTQLVLEPASAQPITVSAFAHPLPGPVVLSLIALALLGAVVAFDRLGPVAEADGALTLSTVAVFGTALVFWTSNTVHPDFSTLIGAAIFGGAIGFGVGALVWWIAKRLIVRPAA
jgi:hypothetical protein